MSESPKQTLKRATAVRMGELVKQGRKLSERQRAFDQGRAEERARIVAWLRHEASFVGQPPVDRAECCGTVASVIEAGGFSGSGDGFGCCGGNDTP